MLRIFHSNVPGSKVQLEAFDNYPASGNSFWPHSRDATASDPNYCEGQFAYAQDVLSPW